VSSPSTSNCLICQVILEQHKLWHLIPNFLCVTSHQMLWHRCSFPYLPCLYLCVCMFFFSELDFCCCVAFAHAVLSAAFVSSLRLSLLLLLLSCVGFPTPSNDAVMMHWLQIFSRLFMPVRYHVGLAHPLMRSWLVGWSLNGIMRLVNGEVFWLIFFWF